MLQIFLFLFFYAMVLIKGKLLDFVETYLDSKEVVNLAPGEQVFLLR